MLKAQHLYTYDDIPVHYCGNCLSLKILRLEGMGDPEMCYCDACGSTDVQQAPIEKWEEMYMLKYKHPYLKTVKNY